MPSRGRDGRGRAGHAAHRRAAAATLRGMSVWTEVGDRVFARRYAFYDQNIGAILGDDGVLIVDTRISHRQADEILRRPKCAHAAARPGRRRTPTATTTTRSATTGSGRRRSGAMPAARG